MLTDTSHEQTSVQSPLQLQSPQQSKGVNWVPRSHNKFKSVFDASGINEACGSTSTVATKRRSVVGEQAFHPVTLLFDNPECEDWFVIRFYSRNRNTALAGLIVFFFILAITSSVVLTQPRLHFASYRGSQILATSLSFASVIAALAAIAAHDYWIVRKQHPAAAGAIVVKKDRLELSLASWWEASIVLAHFAAISWSVTLVVGKAVGCMGADSIDDPIENQRCVTTLQFDGVLIAPMILHGLVYPVRWFLHIPLTAAMLVVLFGIRFLPQITLSVTEPKFVMTTAFVFSIPIVVSAVIRYQRERDQRRLLLTELKLEVALRHLGVLKARHESLLTPWVPLPVEEQVKLLRSAQHGCHLWGLSSQTFVGVIQFRDFGSWVCRVGACDSARALCRLVDTADTFYELLSPLSLSILKCHVSGDRYLLVCPDAVDGGLLLLMVYLACQEYKADLCEHDWPHVRGAVASGVLGVTAFAASGTLTPVGPAMDRLSGLLRCDMPSLIHAPVAPPDVLVAPSAPDIFSWTPSGQLCAEAETTAHPKAASSTRTLQTLELVPESRRHQLVKILSDRVIKSASLVVFVDTTTGSAEAAPQSWSSPLPMSSTSDFPVDATHDHSVSMASNVTAGSMLSGDRSKRLHRNSDVRQVGTVGGPLNDHNEFDTRTLSATLSHSGTRGANRPDPRVTSKKPADGGPAATSAGLQMTSIHTNLSSYRSCIVLAHETFVDPVVERRYWQHRNEHVPSFDLVVASVAAFVMSSFLVIICIVYGTTSMEVPSSMSCSVAALITAACLALSSFAHAQHGVNRKVVLVLYESLFAVFYATVIGANYSGEPYTSPLGDTQLVWHFMLLSINFVRPRAHGLAHHVTLDIIASAAFVVQALIYPHHTRIMRYLNVVCAAAIGIAALLIHSLMDCEERQKFSTEVSLKDLHIRLTLLSEEVKILLANTQANNPAAIFAARANRNRKFRRGSQHIAADSPLREENVDPSTSTTIASRAMDSAVLIINFTPTASNVVSTKGLQQSATLSKAFIEAVEHVILTLFCKSLRIVHATPSSMMILSNASVVGHESVAALSSRSLQEIFLIELAMEVVWRLCPTHHMTARAVIDSGLMVGVLLGSSSMSFEFTGPALERARHLVHAAPWGHVFVTQRVLRYCGLSTSSSITIRTTGGLAGVVGHSWQPWRVRSCAKVFVSPVVNIN
jgi:hypothetical protein